MLIRIRNYLIWVSFIAFASAVHGDWPTEAASPLKLGNVLGFGSEHTVALTPDGATWVAWIDEQCFPSLMVQRISAQGNDFSEGALLLDTQDTCISLTAQIEALSDNTIVVSAVGSDPVSTPVHRIDASGQELWPPDVIANDLNGDVQSMLALAQGDALIASQNGLSIEVGRYAADGTRTWDLATSFLSGGGLNMRVIAFEADGNDGAYLLWDFPQVYTRRTYTQRITSNGTPAWETPQLVHDIIPGASRHTDPDAIPDGLGGLIFVWTQGAEQSQTPMPLRMQRILSDGSLIFDTAGIRISTAATRQFDVQIRQRTSGGDLFIAWRDGPFDKQTIRVQRITLDGHRIWGDTGVLVTPIIGSTSQFTLDWLDSDTLGIVVTDNVAQDTIPRVNVHRVDLFGQVASTPWPISGTVSASTIKSVSLDNALAVVWQRQLTNNQGEVVAQRINQNGALGSVDSDGDGISDVMDNCTAASNPNQVDTDADGIGNFCDPDFNNDCSINFIDFGGMTAAFLSTTSPLFDLNEDGVVNFIDVSIFQQFFLLSPGPSGLVNACSLSD